MRNEKYTMELVKQLGIEPLLKQYPHEVSGGETAYSTDTRIGTSEPELLLLDESFSALDEKTKYHSYEQLLAIHKKWQIPILLVSHNRQEVDLLADKILYIEKGKLVQQAYKNAAGKKLLN